MTPKRIAELKERLEDSELTLEESVECLDTIDRLTAENAELKHQIEVEAMQTSDRINDLQSENAELRKATGEAFENGKRVMLSFIQENGLVEAWRICDELKPEAKP